MKFKRYLALIILTAFIIIAIVGIPSLFVSFNGSCTADVGLTILSDFVSISLRAYIPFGLMVVFNIIMIYKLISILKNSSIGKTSKRRREYQFTFTVMVSLLFFFVVNFPQSLYYIFVDKYQYSGAFLEDRAFTAKYYFVSVMVENISFFQQTFSFLMFLIFNKLYRREFLTICNVFLNIQLSFRKN